ncbi:UDP-N-acetylglucosamine 2-epimerase (non-hydrolyzing) [Luteimonas sp. SJ-92]|uniref:UDP-N-acetylglucosamine 2-epimerase (non-hydrolyzing) n=1 Tax=Luteimonas salinisoli TaxID=2752307 RepID=A0A853J8Y8_9GAMM|nr:UDP-N-acetylglucosamine 2-epimerase (non-hydrolyzing) [Luteimonas salinisoli]NZA25325.1 UDP-N-acetylglucosamine 2-epimerase (non-hydrolyzing) [Luteimonas salinisoli]
MAAKGNVRKSKILVAIGTRPEAIKMAPVVQALRSQDWVEVVVLATAQHRQMLDQVLNVFGIVPDVDLDIMRQNQSLSDLTARLIQKLDHVLEDIAPDAVLVQGDTTTVLAVALSSFYRRISIGHVEAGLRTGDMRNPFPEEMNRSLAGRLCRWHFAPTDLAARNLYGEGFSDHAVHVTGNTVIDALQQVASRELEIGVELEEGKRLVLVTAHRRENFGDPFLEICAAIRELADVREDIQILYPVHPNPNISTVARSLLASHPRIVLCEPLDYLPFVAAMKRAEIVLTDSGGVQEEAPALAKPVLVLRDETERPEAVEQGVVRLVGPHREAIVREACLLLDDRAAYSRMAKGVSPYGDGNAASRIAEILRRDLSGAG